MIVFSRQAKKALEGMDAATRKRIQIAIDQLPYGDVRPLSGYLDNRHRLRVGKYRIVFKFDSDEELRIIDIGSRGGIYK